MSDETTEKFLLCLSDALTLIEILELARTPNLALLPRTGLIELALSSHGQALSGVVWGTHDSKALLDAWLHDTSRIETKEIGKINFASFLWGFPTATNRISIQALSSQYKKHRLSSEKNHLFDEIERAEVECCNPILFCARETSDQRNYMDVCLMSRYSKLDNRRKQLIPSGVVRAISKAPELKNVSLLNAILKKIIGLTFNLNQKERLQTTRHAMLKAVESNPSLRGDIEQLLMTRFYENESVQECLQRSPYYQEVMMHLRGERPAVEASSKEKHVGSFGV